MENAFSVTFSQMLVLFSFMLIGFFLNRKKIMPENTGVILSKAENDVFMPCLILNTFITKCTVTTLREKGDLLLYSTAALFLAILLAYGLARFFSKDAYTRNVYKYALAIGNFGFMGNAVVLAVFGEAMLFDYLIFTLPLNIAVYTWGLMILIPGGGKKAPLKNLLNPVCLSLAAGILLGLLSAQTFLPAFVMSAVSAGGACMAPVAMLLTGFTIGSYDLKKNSFKRQNLPRFGPAAFGYPRRVPPAFQSYGRTGRSSFVNVFQFCNAYRPQHHRLPRRLWGRAYYRGRHGAYFAHAFGYHHPGFVCSSFIKMQP